MKHILLALTIGLASSATAIGGATVPNRLDAASGKPPCTAKFTKIEGHRAVIECGPATASLRVGGKTYNFNDGHCVAGNGQYFTLDLGVAVSTGGANAGKPNLSIFAESATFASLSASFGGRLVVSDSIINLKSHGLLSGTFKSSIAVSGAFTGSWKCNGALSAY
ncbi:MAG TPA: hypothetical protein VN786_01635 [Acidimicrobiales bacterium]|nr:hypothetical protein [Acidimicrobiales bacterium]